MPKMNKNGLYFVSSIIVCTAVNVLFSYIVISCGLPLYLDTIGIFLMTFLGGFFPGIITAVATNLLCGFFNPDSMYYAFIGVMMALCTSNFSRNERYKKKVNIVWFILVSSLISGIIGVGLQWILIGKSQFDYVSDIASMLAGDNKYKFFGYSLLLSILINLVDKGFSIAIAIALLRLVPDKVRVMIKNCGYKQRPLTKDELAGINIKDGGRSLRVRMTGMLVGIVFTLTFILSIVSIRIVYEDAAGYLDSSLGDYHKFVIDYSIKLMLVFSGFFVLILTFGLWIFDNTLLYPIVSLKKSIESFMEGMGDQEKLDESVRSLQKLDIRTNDEVEKLYKLICEMTVGTTEQMRSIRMLARSNVRMQAGLIITMADIVENRNFEAKSHVQKIAAYVRLIMYGLKRKGYYAEKLTDKFMNDVEISAPLYDIGKINVPDAILKKPGKLTDDEFEQIKLHTTAGQKILENAISTMEGENYLKEARNMVAYHHERWDGTGYPEGLHGQVIPLSARIMAVADVFDALTSERVYKKAYPIEKAIEIMNEGAGSQFDPKCVEVFMDQIADVKKIMKKYQ